MTALFASSGVKLSFLRILRMLRVVRVLRLMKSWRGLYHILSTFMRAIPQMQNLFVLMLIFMLIFSLIGMQIFGGAFTPENGYSLEPCPGGLCPDPSLRPLPRFHFNYFVPAIETVFVLMTGEWVDAMEPGVGAIGPVAAWYYTAVVLLGRYFLINLLVAIVLDSFAKDDPDDTAELTPEELELRESLKSRRSTRRRRGDLSARELTRQLVAPLEDDEAAGTIVWPRDYSLCLFSVRNPLRQGCLHLVAHPAFDAVVSLAIIVSSVCLALDSPRLDPASPLHGYLTWLDWNVWPWFFLGELMIKVVAYGFACSDAAYIGNPWNQLDFAIVVSSLLVLATAALPWLAPLKNLRILRVLRPLRLVSRDPGMKLVLTSLFKAIPAVSNVAGVILAVQLVFAVLGMQLFMGRLATCTNPMLMTKSECLHAAVPPPPLPPPPPRRALVSSSSSRALLDAATARRRQQGAPRRGGHRGPRVGQRDGGGGGAARAQGRRQQGVGRHGGGRVGQLQGGLL